MTTPKPVRTWRVLNLSLGLDEPEAEQRADAVAASEEPVHLPLVEQLAHLLFNHRAVEAPQALQRGPGEALQVARGQELLLDPEGPGRVHGGLRGQGRLDERGIAAERDLCPDPAR